jgi:hypothetical protein
MCDLENLKKRPCPALGCSATEKKKVSFAFPLHPLSTGTLKKSQSLRAASTYENSNNIVNFVASGAPNNQKFKLLLFGMNYQCIIIH